jgi:cysteinyl-tRNA synthetase
MLKLYNTLTRKVEEFKPITGEKVGMYACGPTVYDFAHIGNLRTYIFNDLLKRVLVYLGFKVTHVMNLTDIDDKTIAAAQQEKVPLREYTDRYIKIFFEDLEKLNIPKPDITPRATDHIEEMIKMVKTLVDKGLAYKGADGSIYFDIAKFPQYGQLSGVSFVKGLKAGARVAADEYEKEQAADFALWKAYSPEDGEVFWDSPFGKGRPGWHIECSAMSTKYLGESFELHTGAVDLIFPHHENEIAQTVGATGKPWVKYWVHGEHLLVEGRKMAKSEGNFYRLSDITERGFNPLAFRYLALTVHYRQKLNFTWEGIQAAQNALERLYQTARELKEKGDKGNREDKGEKKWERRFVEAVADDLGMPQALAVVWEMLKSDLGDSEKYRLLLDWDGVLGLDLEKVSSIKYQVLRAPEEVEKLAQKREKLRQERKFAEADKVREEIEAQGWLVEDTPAGPQLKPKS